MESIKVTGLVRALRSCASDKRCRRPRENDRSARRRLAYELAVGPSNAAVVCVWSCFHCSLDLLTIRFDRTLTESRIFQSLTDDFE